MKTQLQHALLPLQTWHKSRLDGIRSQPVMEVVISNPGNNADKGKKTGVTCLLTEARKTESDSNKKLQNLVESLEQHSSKIGLTQVVDTAKLNTLPAVDTRFGCFPVGSFGSYQLTFTESNFSFTSSFKDFKQLITAQLLNSHHTLLFLWTIAVDL